MGEGRRLTPVLVGLAVVVAARAVGTRDEGLKLGLVVSVVSLPAPRKRSRGKGSEGRQSLLRGHRPSRPRPRRRTHDSRPLLNHCES